MTATATGSTSMARPPSSITAPFREPVRADTVPTACRIPARAIAAGGGTITNNAGGNDHRRGPRHPDRRQLAGSCALPDHHHQLGHHRRYDVHRHPHHQHLRRPDRQQRDDHGGGGTAIQFGAGNNTLRLGATSTINGLSDGEGGTNTLDYSTFGAAGVTVNLGAGTATGTGGVANFQDVIGSAGNDTITGSGAVNVLGGGNGNDSLDGGEGIDQLEGGDGNDTYTIDDAGEAVVEVSGTDLVRSTATKTLAAGFENLTLLGAASIERHRQHFR